MCSPVAFRRSLSKATRARQMLATKGEGGAACELAFWAGGAHICFLMSGISEPELRACQCSWRLQQFEARPASDGGPCAVMGSNPAPPALAVFPLDAEMTFFPRRFSLLKNSPSPILSEPGQRTVAQPVTKVMAASSLIGKETAK
jgi:hypothetical protein